MELVFEKDYSNCITFKDNARDIISSIGRNNIIKEIAKQALRVSVSDNRFGYLPMKAHCIKFLDYLKSYRIAGTDIIPFLKENRAVLEEISSSFAKIRYKNRENINIDNLDKYSTGKIKKYLHSLSDDEILENARVTNLRIFDKSINRCRDDIVRGIQLRKGNVDYKEGKSMFATSIVGKSKMEQEDSVLLIEHPSNKSFKMLMVADGVGGSYNGGKASSYMAKRILSWFESLDKKYFDNIEELSKKLNLELNKINTEIAKKGDGRATTFVCGIIGNSKSLITSVGDSRAYVTKDNELFQISRDDSLVQDYFDNGLIDAKDDMRFHINSNFITQCLGMEGEIYPNSYILKNKFDSLILVSDGISDCLSDSQIMAITTKTPIEEIARALVSNANSNTSYRNLPPERYYYEEIPGGKDNMTAAVYSKGK